MERCRRTQFDMDGDREARSLAPQPRSKRSGQLDGGSRWSQAHLAAKVGLKRTRIGDIERGEATGTPLIVWVRLGIALRRPIAMSFSRDLEPPTPVRRRAPRGQELLLRFVRATGRTGLIELPTQPDNPSLSVDVCIRDDPHRVLILQRDLEPVRRPRPCDAVDGPEDRRSGRARYRHRRRPSVSRRIVLAPGRHTPRNRQMLAARYPEVLAARFPGSSCGVGPMR